MKILVVAIYVAASPAFARHEHDGGSTAQQLKPKAKARAVFGLGVGAGFPGVTVLELWWKPLSWLGFRAAAARPLFPRSARVDRRTRDHERQHRGI